MSEWTSDGDRGECAVDQEAGSDCPSLDVFSSFPKKKERKKGRLTRGSGWGRELGGFYEDGLYEFDISFFLFPSSLGMFLWVVS